MCCSRVWAVCLRYFAGNEAGDVESDEHGVLSGMPVCVSAPVRCDLAGCTPAARSLVLDGTGESIALPSWCD